MRTAVPVDRDLFTKAVQEAEANGPLHNLNALHNRIAELYNLSAGDLPTISFSVAGSRIVEFGLIVQTKAGKRGRGAGQPMSEEQKQKLLLARQNAGPRKSRSEKFKSNPKIAAGFVQLRKNMRELANGTDKYERVVDRIEKGSVKAALYANCMQCIGGSGRDAKNCQESCCPFYAMTCSIFKRGQKASENQSEDDDALLNEISETENVEEAA